MQINGAQLATLYISKPVGVEDKARTPVVIDGTSFKVEEVDEQQSAAADRKPIASAIEFSDAQQSQFIRSFTLGESSLPAQTPKLTTQTQPLPESVQQYIQISRLDDESPEQLFDERA